MQEGLKRAYFNYNKPLFVILSNVHSNG